MRAARAIAVAALLASSGAAAEEDVLQTVRAGLKQLAGTTPVKVAIERAVTVDRKDRPLEVGRINIAASGGPEGTAIRYPAALLEAMRQERADPDPDKPKPYRRTLEDFDAIDVGDLLNGASSLLSDLDGATLKGVVAEDYAGTAAQRLDLDLVVRTSKADSKWMKRASRTMKLWVTPDGVPLGSESTAEFQVGLLFFTFDGAETRTLTYSRTGDRLLVLRRQYRFDGQGLGEDQHNQSDTTLRLQGS